MTSFQYHGSSKHSPHTPMLGKGQINQCWSKLEQWPICQWTFRECTYEPSNIQVWGKMWIRTDDVLFVLITLPTQEYSTACCYYSVGHVVQVVWNCCQYHVHTRSTYACMWLHLQDLPTAVQSTTSTNLSTGNVLQSLHKIDTNVRGSSTECIYSYFLLTMLFRSQNSWKLQNVQYASC